MMTGDDNITKIHIEAALEHCTTFIVLNTTFTTIEPDVAYILTSRCPGNCSENGQCNAGICTCHEGFAGSDCSFDSSEPPQITGTSYDFCDQRSHECNALYFQGSYFLENMGAVCYTERNERNMDNSLRSSDFYMASLEEQTLFLGSCELRNSSGGYWVTDFTINITIDGIRFTSDYKVTIYSSVCQQYHNDSGHVYFTLKNGYCFINSTSSCVADGDSKEFDYCSVCNTSVNSFDWTENTECLFLASNSTQNSTPIASITTSDISMTPLTTTTSEAPAAPTTTRTSLSTIPTSLANLSTDTKQFETTIPTADLTTTTSTKILEKTTASQTTAQAKSATITSPVTKSTTPTTSITSPMTISIISTSLQPPTTIPTITSPTAGSESLISSSKSSSTTKMHQTTSTTSPESSVEPKPQSTEASTEKILTTQSQWTPESSDSPSSLFLSTPQTSNDSDQKQAIIIASCLVCGMIVLIVSGVVLKKYCIRQGNIDDPYIQENNIQYPDRSDNTKKSSISIDFITKNTKLPEDILPSRPTSASSYYSTGVQQLSSTTDLRDVFNGNGMKDRSLLFRASSPK
ncbi:mucin-2-like [Saccostrea cucullata]|uniref:mucin-2-like n=1 Tax=Saccostrea cuccullata TaxID=36930 RepID=UPI002ED3C42B